MAGVALRFVIGRDHRVAAIRDWFDRYVRNGAPLPDLEPHGR
jgi:hypothetical protein